MEKPKYLEQESVVSERADFYDAYGLEAWQMIQVGEWARTCYTDTRLESWGEVDGSSGVYLVCSPKLNAKGHTPAE